MEINGTEGTGTNRHAPPLAGILLPPCEPEEPQESLDHFGQGFCLPPWGRDFVKIYTKRFTMPDLFMNNLPALDTIDPTTDLKFKTIYNFFMRSDFYARDPRTASQMKQFNQEYRHDPRAALVNRGLIPAKSWERWLIGYHEEQHRRLLVVKLLAPAMREIIDLGQRFQENQDRSFHTGQGSLLRHLVASFHDFQPARGRRP